MVKEGQKKGCVVRCARSWRLVEFAAVAGLGGRRGYWPNLRLSWLHGYLRLVPRSSSKRIHRPHFEKVYERVGD